MLLHKNEWYPTYPECPERGVAVRDRCDSYDLLSRCILMTADPAQDDILLYIHRNTHIVKTAQTEHMNDNERRSLSGGLDSAYFNEHTNVAARLAVGSLIQAVESVHRGEVRNAFCLVRPPGHHAMEDEACGFCIFNNVALAAQYALDKLEYNRVLILDWDVHHGQATQYSFYDSSRVLYISIHRYDEQTFWPSLRESNFDFIGSGRGRGYNINIPLNGGPYYSKLTFYLSLLDHFQDDLGDAEYLAIFHRLILPVAYEFDPDLILVSAGYDCAYGCPLGQLKVSPPLFAHFTHKLMGLAEGKIIVSLEGGYYHDSLAESAAHTVSALLGDPMPSLEPVGEVHPSVLETIANCVSVLRFRWRSLSVFQVPEVVPAAEKKHLPEQTWERSTAPVWHIPPDVTYGSSSLEWPVKLHFISTEGRFFLRGEWTHSFHRMLVFAPSFFRQTKFLSPQPHAPHTSKESENRHGAFSCRSVSMLSFYAASRLDVKVPIMKPEKHIHDPEDAIRIDQHMSYLKRTHPVALHKHFPSTCIVYDSRMENHKNEEDPNHPEAPSRIRRTYELLDEYGLARRCKRVEARYATRTELCRVHAAAYVDMIAKTAALDQTALDSLSNEENSIFFNRVISAFNRLILTSLRRPNNLLSTLSLFQHTYDCARLAAGSVLAVVDEVCTGQSLNGVALVRPPGHHALTDKCMGFCFFNNVAVGAKHAQQVHGLERIAIVDWDVHHGNGTEKIFENDPSVLFISVHRYDEGRYYPGTADADPTVCGSEDGLGRTVQVAWNGRHVKDGEYIAVFVHIILPILYEFRPQLILVSAGFDAARGDRLGGLGVSPECFAHLTHLLLTAAYLCPAKSVTDDKTDSQISTPVRQTRHRLAQQQRTFTGGLILALEGGYHLAATAEAMCHSVASLLGDCCPRLAFGLSPTEKRGPEPFCSTAFYYFSSNLCVDGGVEPSDEVYAHKKRIGNQFKVMEYFGFIVTLRFALRLGPVRGQLITDESGRLSGSSEHHIGSQSALAFTGQLETEIQSRLEDLSLSDGASRSVGSPLSHPAAPISPSFSLAVTSPIGIGSVSTSVPTNGVAARVPAATEQETLQDLGTDLFNSHMSAGHVASTSVIPSSSSATLQGTVNLPQLIDEFTQMRVASPNTGQSDRSSLASDVPSPVQHRLTLTNAAGASGHAQSSSTPIASAGNQVVAIATLQDLMNVASIETEDMHAFFGLESSQQLPERLFAVTPLSWCPHLTSVHNNPEWNPNIRETCNRCTNQTENWVCLTCYSVFCGRYANSHMVEHFTSTRHPLVLSFADLSSWCYECEAYVHNELGCGRYANSHMLEHFSATQHPIVLSFADLSTWCYQCESYVNNEVLSGPKHAVHLAKFGEGLPGPLHEH
ncbi:hypothetical protein T265_06715 [Opisthorchis viverrini]|uniref:UBP-type domain-containing protein n=1 Tax=Opisthorchis viverrini TaxID=6198 RepID=A0A074ZRI7_OPIVI|nr:hypothetical protein T265_06715 [Opisthorchis viverrini]KER25965.1 hypothetical protein T265_06715 [Opisthorchis viverrini]